MMFVIVFCECCYEGCMGNAVKKLYHFTPGSPDDPVINGSLSSEDSSNGPRKSDIIIITGKPENCQNAKQALLVRICFFPVSGLCDTENRHSIGN